MTLRGLFFLVAAAAAAKVTPIEKVITLIDNMKKEVEANGQAEAKAYGEFACFCKDTTGGKSTSVQDMHDKIEAESSDIAEKTANRNGDLKELGERKTKQETLAAKLQGTNTRCTKEKAEYNAEASDLSKAISSLKNAIKSIEDSKPSSAPALLQSSAHQDLMETLAMAEAMSMIPAPKHTAVVSMIQGKASVNPEDPEYEFKSGGILKLLQDLEVQFKESKSSVDSEFNKGEKACNELKASLKKDMSSNTDAMAALDKRINRLAKEIAQHRENLVEAEAQLRDDELYLKDLQKQCEARANDYDQRSAMRNDEITALSKALEILSKDVKGRADDVNARALLIQKVQKPAAQAAAAAGIKKDSKPAAPVKAAGTVKESAAQKKPISFLQASNGLEDRKEHALKLLVKEGQRLNSFVLTSLAQRSAADPFKKVKGLIEKLIQRLIAEATSEATKKGFCDTELGKARKTRDFQRVESNDISAQLEGLEAKRDELEQEIKQLTEDMASETTALKENTASREEDKTENLATLKTAKEGFEAVNEALLILKSFYKQAAKAAFIQASPLDEDNAGPGFSGSYKGNQSGSQAVLSLLETISSDFDRTIRTTTASEEAAHRDFIDMMQATESSIASKTTKKELDEQDLKTTKATQAQKMEDLQAAVDLLDRSLQELEELKPVCIDTGMSYAERVEKREEEMEALKKALCILDTDGVESECNGSLQ
jgi:hypothetical protein